MLRLHCYLFLQKSTMIFTFPLIAALVTFLLLLFLLSTKIIVNVLDVPNERSLHSRPVPRYGGMGLIVGVLSAWVFMFNALVWWLVLPLLLLFIISLLDDMHSLSVKHRLLVHLIAGAMLVGGSGLYVQHGALIALVVLLLSVWMINLYNFMDGSDGLAGGMALFGFGIFGIAAWLAQNPELAILNFCIAASALSFLYFNFQPSKIFLGDAGSIPLGFLVAAMSVRGWQQGSWAAWFPLLVFSPFIADASVTLIKRTLRGAKITEAHREHYYQRLILIGWGHRNVALAEYVLMMAVGFTALWAQHNPFPWQILLAWSAGYLCLMLLLDISWNNLKRGKND